MNHKRVLTVCGHRHKDKGKEQDRCWICTKPVFEHEQNAKQATESSPAERAELETLAGTTEAAQSMWPELKPTYGVFTESSDPKNLHGSEKKSQRSFWNVWEEDNFYLRCACRQRPLQRGKIKDFDASFNLAAVGEEASVWEHKGGGGGVLKSKTKQPQWPSITTVLRDSPLLHLIIQH